MEEIIDNCKEKMAKENFQNWLQKNIIYKENELLQLKDICELFLNKSKLF